jgi:hypothetical protein
MRKLGLFLVTKGDNDNVACVLGRVAGIWMQYKAPYCGQEGHLFMQGFNGHLKRERTEGIELVPLFDHMN